MVQHISLLDKVISSLFFVISVISGGIMSDTIKNVRYMYNELRGVRAFDVSAVVTAYNFESKPHFAPRMEKYNFSQILLVLDGEGTYTTEDSTYRFFRGDMLYRPALKSSVYEWSTDNVKLALISFVCDSPAMSVFEGKPIKLFEEEEATLFDVIKTTSRICEAIDVSDEYVGMRIRDGVPDVVLGFISSSLERFLSMLYCRLKGIEIITNESQKVNMYHLKSKLAAAVKSYFAENIEKRLTIDDICREMGVSQSKLSKAFRQEAQCGLMEYFTYMKINEAKSRIRKSDKSFTQISEELGYDTPAYFSKVFKKYTGMTPTGYSKYVSKRRSDV